MNSTWTGLSIATRGLFASSAGLMVTTNNLSNASTKGYSRQEVNQTAVTPAAVYNSRYMIGAGSEVESVTRIRSFRLDTKYWTANGSLGEIQTKSDLLSEVEETFGETGTSSAFTTTMSNFTSALETLNDTPNDDSARVQVQQMGEGLCEYLNSTSEELTTLRENINSEVKSTVGQINSYADQIASMNKQIRIAAAGGASTNELEDQRTLLIDKLSELTDVNVTENVIGELPDGTDDTILTITVNGQTLVNNGTARELECYQITDGSSQDGMYGIRWTDTEEDFAPESGTLKAYLDIRDGTGKDSEYQGIPYYVSQLDTFARTVAKAFNEGIFADGSSSYTGHAGGYGLDGSTGVRFFSYDDHSTAELLASGVSTTDYDSIYNNITAANISLSKEVSKNTDTIAAADAANEEENNKNVDELIDLMADADMFNIGSPLDFMNSILGTAGTTGEYSATIASKQSTILNNINTRRTSVSGVSNNEETANLTKYQEAYEASANTISIWSEIYQTTINMVSSD